MRRYFVVVIAGFSVIALLAAVGFSYYRWKYPYGLSHCCIKGMWIALYSYAEDHDGRFPAGESSPEASLSLLYSEKNAADGWNYIGAGSELRGMTVSEDTVLGILEEGKLLGPDTCGWHYVEGLTLADDPRLALLWPKVALGHNGRRMRDGGREVLLLAGHIEYIPGDKWEAFLEEQKQLLAERDERAKAGKAVLVSAVIELPDGSPVEKVESFYTLKQHYTGSGSSAAYGGGTYTASGLSCKQLNLYRPRIANGSLTRVLSFGGLVSDPVTVTFVGGVPDKTNVVFKMRKK